MPAANRREVCVPVARAARKGLPLNLRAVSSLSYSRSDMRLAAAAAAAVGAWCAAATVHAVPQVAEEPQSAAAAQCPKCPVKQHEVGRRPVYPPTARHRSPHSPRCTPLYMQAHHPPIGHDDIHGLLGAGPPPIMPCE